MLGMMIPLLNKGGDPYWNYTVFSCAFNGADTATSATDDKAGKTITFIGNAQLDTAQKKFGTASLLLDGTGDSCSLADHADFTFTGAFTIECFIRCVDATPATEMYLFHIGGMTVSLETNGDLIGAISTGGGGFNTRAASGMADATWYHIALARTLATNGTKLFVNGVQVGSNFGDSNAGGNQSHLERIGAVDDTGSPILEFNGWIDSFRVTNGVNRYPNAFTPPAAAFPIY